MYVKGYLFIQWYCRTLTMKIEQIECLKYSFLVKRSFYVKFKYKSTL